MDPTYGGPIEGVRRQDENRRKYGVTTEVVSLDHPTAPYIVDFPMRVHALGERCPRWGLPARYRYSPDLVPWLRKHSLNYDAVIVNGLWNFGSVATNWALRGNDTPYFVFTHGMLDPWFNRAYPLKTIAKRLWWPVLEHPVLRDAASVLYTTEEERILAHQAFQPYRCHESVVGYGTAPPPPCDEAAVASFRASLPSLGQQPYLLFLSRLHPKKGCDILIEAFADASRAYPDVHLVMAGPDQIGWKSKLEAQAQELGISHRVHWAGMRSGADKWAAYYGATAFALASHSENFGIVVAEALACGLPVLITDKVNIWREIQEDGAGLVSDDSVQPFARNLGQFLEMKPGDVKSMGERAKACFERHFHVEAAAISVIRVIESELAARAGRATRR